MNKMKKLLFFTVALSLLSVGTVSAQKNAVKSAKRALDSKDLNEARTLMKGAITNPESMNDPDTWKIYGDIGNKVFDDERIKQTLGQKADDNAMYNGLLESYYPYVKADSLGQLPDSKGKVKNKVRKDVASILKANHPYYINGGVYYNEQKNYNKATDFFEIYWNIPSLPMYEGEANAFVIDSTFQIIKYYAIITSIQAENYSKAEKLLNRAINEPFIENTAFIESDLYELLASTYIQQGDSAKYLEVLYKGAEKFPKSKYFIPNLVNVFIRRGENTKALDYLDVAIKNDPTNSCDLNSVKGALLAEKGNFDAAEIEYNKALAQDPNCERALEAIAVNYILQAQELKELTSKLSDRQKQMENDKKTVDFYQKSLAPLEKYTALLKARNAEKGEINPTYMKLRNVYYNLSNMGVDKSKELEVIEKELGVENQ